MLMVESSAALLSRNVVSLIYKREISGSWNIRVWLVSYLIGDSASLAAEP